MQKLIKWCKDNVLMASSLFLMAFIPLYPKLPLVDIRNTWVYVRVEDFVVLFVLFVWILLFLRKSFTIRSPLALPILLYWLVGAIATIHSVLLLAPVIWDIYPNVALLGYLRRIEYMSLYFVVFEAARHRHFFGRFIWILVATVFCVGVYGIGQKYAGFPAFLTMNEEFAKGIPIQLSALSRVSSTFGGHYDLAAYLALTLPIMVSLMFGARGILAKIALGIISLLSFYVLFMTVSRISFFAVLIGLGFVVFFHKRRFVLYAIPIGLVGIVVVLSFFPNLLDRFSSTVSEISVLVDTKTGNPVGHIKDVPNTYFSNKIVWQRYYDAVDDVSAKASPSASFVIDYVNLPQSVVLMTEKVALTGEDLPSGTGYINLTLSPDVKRVGSFLYEPEVESDASGSAEAYFINGEYVVKKALAYDLSFTTRFQGEWPHALTAFKRNILFGSGFGSATLSVDNSYLRMLAEVGLLGFVSFIAIFSMLGIVVYRTLPFVDNPTLKSFVIGFVSGVIAISVNAMFIDVFEASKVAFTLWILAGGTLGTLSLYQKVPIHYFEEMKRLFTSSAAIVLYILLFVFVLYSSMTKNFFIGDDFTWLRWSMQSSASSVVEYFTQSQGFFYRPGTKLYFSLMYKIFWLNQTAFHTVSLFLHGAISVLVYFLAKNIFKKKSLGALAALLFAGLSGYTEVIFWISATGFLFTVLCILLSMLFFAKWRESGKYMYLVSTCVASILALLFHELGIVTIFLLMTYEWYLSGNKKVHWSLYIPLPLYLIARLLASSHWFSGDYNYNILKFPLNALGNSIGYILLSILGPSGLSVYQLLRSGLRETYVLAIVLMIVLFYISLIVIRKLKSTISVEHQKILIFSFLFFVISLLPFLGLGNITSRYSYLASISVVFVMVFAINYFYILLKNSGRDIALVSVGVMMGTFMLYQLVTIHDLHKDWQQAGETSRAFFVAIDRSYQDYWSDTPMEFHFVNVPIRHRSAWVFPVGIADALWFNLQNDQINIFFWPSQEAALQVIRDTSTNQKLFEFDANGKAVEVKKKVTEL